MSPTSIYHERLGYVPDITQVTPHQLRALILLYARLSYRPYLGIRVDIRFVSDEQIKVLESLSFKRINDVLSDWPELNFLYPDLTLLEELQIEHSVGHK